jgi:hypothetical protein
MPHTGEICLDSGIYKIMNHKGEDHPKEITMIKDKPFPPCSHCHSKVEYKLDKKTPH